MGGFVQLFLFGVGICLLAGQAGHAAAGQAGAGLGKPVLAPH